MSTPAAPGRPWSLLVTVEHGGNEVPEEFRDWFRGCEALLDSHRGWDPGTLSLGRELSERLGATLIESRVTRLLVDLNRSPANPTVFSSVTRGRPRAVRDDLIERFHRPHHDSVVRQVEQEHRSGASVLHLGVHSFTPELDGRPRTADLGVLYDPGRPGESAFAAHLAATLKRLLPGWTVRRNYPYRGASDGLVTVLRRRFDSTWYLGIEVEVNQSRLTAEGRFPAPVATALAEAVEGGLAD